MRPSRPAAFAILIGSLAAVGCLGPEKQKEPLVLGQDTRGVLSAANTPARSAVKPAAFEPSNSGGSGLSVQNSFNRTVAGPGTGSSTGGVASRLPPPQVGLPPAVNTPTLAGASYGEPSPDQGRTSMTRAATPPAPPAPPVEGSPFARPQPNLEMPLNEPPVKPVVMKEPEVIRPVVPKEPDAPTAIRPVMPADLDRVPLPTPVMPSVTSITPVAPPAPVMPSVAPVTPPAPLPPAPPAQPGSAANDPLPVPPTYVPSPTEAPIPGVQAPPKLPPAPPIRPQ